MEAKGRPSEGRAQAETGRQGLACKRTVPAEMAGPPFPESARVSEILFKLRTQAILPGSLVPTLCRVILSVSPQRSQTRTLRLRDRSSQEES